MKNPDLLALSLGFSLNLSYVINHACEQKRRPQKRGDVSDGNHRAKKEYSLEKKQDRCQGLVGFAKWVDAPMLFAVILFFLIFILHFQNTLGPI